MKLLGIALMLLSLGALALPAWQIEIVDSSGDVGYYTSLEIDSYDDPCIAYCDQTTLKYAKWNGSSWNIENVDSVGSHCSLVLNSLDNPHISYSDQSFGTLKYARWNGFDWLTEVVDPSGDVGGYTSLALSSTDEPRIAYMKFANLDNPIIEICYASWNGMDWDLEVISSTKIYSGFNISLALDSMDFPHVAYEDYGEILYESLFYASWDGSTWDTDTVSTVMSGYYNSLVFDSLNNPHISYQDWCSGGVKHAFWTGAEWCIEEVSGNGKYISLTLDNQENPSISYQSIEDWYLHYALWNGASWDNEVVDYISGVDYTSHEVFSEGLPCISYYADGDLRFAKRMYSGTDGRTYLEIPAVELRGASPNPSSNSVSVYFSLSVPAAIELTVFDASGRIVASNLGDYPDGVSAVIFEFLSPGVYFCRMIAGDFTATQRFVILE